MTVGVLVMGYGTPASLDDLEAYYTHIRRGRPPTPELLDELRARYEAIGGISPLLARTRAQLDAVAAELERRHPGRFTVALGQKHAAPFIEDGAAELIEAGVGHLVGLVLAPHYSGFSVGQYHGRAEAVAEAAGIGFTGVHSWAHLPAFVAHQAGSIRERLSHLPEATKVLFTAHSLPERVLADDPYPSQLEASALEIANAAGLDRWSGWGIAWQSAGRTPEPWRGPDILEVIADLAATGRAEGVLVCPQGFVSDHLEVTYDLDIEAATAAADLGLAFARTEVVNADPDVMAGLADLVIEAAGDSR